MIVLRFFAIISCLFLSYPAFAEAPQKPVIDIQTTVLPNGAQIWVNYDPRLPIISMHMTLLRGGAYHDPAAKAGQTQILAQMLTEGAGKRDSKAFQESLDNDGIHLDFRADRDDFFGSVYTAKERADIAFSLLSDALNTPLLAQDDLTRIRAGAMSQLRENMGMPAWKIARLTNAITFGSHPYAQNTGGTLHSLPSITPADLQHILQERRNAGQLRISFAGDITLAAARTLVTNLTQSWPALTTPDDVPALGADSFPATTTLHPLAIPQTFIAITRPGLPLNDPDYAAAQVMTHILGGGFGSRLTQILREEKGLTYGINADLVDRVAAPSFEISLSTKNDKANTALTLINTITTQMCDQAVQQDELTNAKSYLIHSVPMHFTSLDATSSQMNAMQAAGLPASYLTDHLAAIAAVTQADVQRVAKRILCTRKEPTRLLVGQPANVIVDKTLTTLPGFIN